jgi:hypothetical protein
LEKIDFEAPAAGFIGSLPLPTANKALEPIMILILCSAKNA